MEAARRVVFKNCLGACEVDMDRFKKFNKDFYYNMKSEQQCLQSCFNERMIQHFGEEKAKSTDGLQIDFALLKRQYSSYEMMNPDFKKTGTFWSGAKEDQIDGILAKIKTKSQAPTNKFDFQ